MHGLRGHPLETWTSSQPADSEGTAGSRRHHIKSWFRSTNNPSANHSTQGSSSSRQPQQVFWIQDFLATDVPQARVWAYGYNADVIGGLFQASNKNSISGHGRDLQVRLEREIENQVILPDLKKRNPGANRKHSGSDRLRSPQPGRNCCQRCEKRILFSSATTYGIDLCLQAIRRSEAARQRTRFIVFLGTPHRGSRAAGWGEVAANLAQLALQDTHTKIVETLEVDSEVLDMIHEQFVEALPDHTRVHSFQEGRGMSGVKGLHEKVGCSSFDHAISIDARGHIQVVSDFSSKLGLPKIENVESIDANHVQMARCADRSDESYRSIAGVLKQFLKNANLRIDLPVRSATHAQGEAISTTAHDTEAC